jgi:aminopeptidase YwaD
MKRKFVLILNSTISLFLLSTGNVFSQNYSQDKAAIEQRIKKDLTILASDSLLGREAGTQGEIMARDYIVNAYKSMGIAPAFKEGSYLQPFTFKDTPSYGDSNYLEINKKKFKFESDFYPLAYSASTELQGELVKVGYGIIVPKKSYDDYKNLNDIKGKIFVIETSIPSQYASDTLFGKYKSLQRKIDTAIAKGASGIVFINSDTSSLNPPKYLGMRVYPADILVIFCDKDASNTITESSKSTARIKVDIIRKMLTGYNVGAFIDNKAKTTIIIGGHYDHLGMGKENSTYVGPPMIHNGADDNGSGSVAVMETARYFKNSAKKNNNYLFLNFSAEEKGLIGSANFTRSDAFDSTKINYMINLDMVGRYTADSLKSGLEIIGTGTSPEWDTLISTNPNDAKLKIKRTKTGFDGSDQMSFYMKNVPVLFFFTGIHADYHKPSDDVDKINFGKEAEIIEFVERLIERTDSLGKIPFSKTKEVSNTGRATMTVSLGIIPDHAWDGKGLRINGVTEGKPAFKAGLKDNDIILKIGDHEVSEIMSYMKALSYFKKGDKALLMIKRGEEIIMKEVQF